MKINIRGYVPGILMKSAQFGKSKVGNKDILPTVTVACQGMVKPGSYIFNHHGIRGTEDGKCYGKVNCHWKVEHWPKYTKIWIIYNLDPRMFSSAASNTSLDEPRKYIEGGNLSKTEGM